MTEYARLEPAYTLLHGPVWSDPVPPHPLADWLLADVNAVSASPLNPEQERAFREILATRLMLLWGPAGTGKTAVLAAGIRGLVLAAVEEGRPIRIGIGAASYNAVDTLLSKVADALSANGIAGPQLSRVALYRLKSASAQLLADPRVQEVERGEAAAALLAARLKEPTQTIILAGLPHQLHQLARATRRDDLPARWFDVLFLDESSQIQVTDAATYYCLLAQDARVVLAGDHRQLGPITQYQPQDTRNGLFGSVFDYMQETHGVEPIQLVVNYRTNEEIAGWPRERFYRGQYQAYFPDRRLAPATAFAIGDEAPVDWPPMLPWSPAWARILDPEVPVVVLSYRARRHTLSNPFEAHVVACLATLLRRHLPRRPGLDADAEVTDFWSSQLAIVTPHRAQMSVITNLLVSSGAFPRRPRPQVDTVDRFQGQERDVILASFSVNDPDFIAAEERFILDPRRFNVTLTRARAKFVIVVSESLLQHLPYEKDIAEEAAGLQLFGELFCRTLATLDLPYVENGQLQSMQVRMRSPAA